MVRLIISAVFIAIGCAPGQMMADETMGFVRDEYRKIITALEAVQEDDADVLLSQWQNHVAKTTNYANEDFLAAIGQLQADYYREIANYEKIIETVKSDSNNHSSVWLDDLMQKFGEDYVKKNRNAILENIMLLFHGRHEFYYRKVSEKLVYKEAVLYSTYKSYFELFTDFHNALSQAEQESLRPQKEAIDAFLLLLNRHSVKKILTSDDMPSREILTIRTRRQDEKLFSFFQKFTTTRSFDPMKAAKDLSRITDKD